jgi:hypothetical protein
MKMTFLALALLAAGAPQAHDTGKHVGCDINSDYSFSTHGQAFVFEQKEAAPHHIALGGGKLFVDGREAALNETDRARLRQFEGEIRALLPEVQQVSREAIDIAFTALVEVAQTLSSEPAESVKKLKQAQALAQKELQGSPQRLFGRDHEPDVDRIIEPILADFIPEVTGGAVRLAMKAVFADDKERRELEARMQRMQRTLHDQVETRAKALEPRAEAMCRRLRALDSIDNQLEYRLPNGNAIEFLRVRHDDAKGEVL